MAGRPEVRASQSEGLPRRAVVLRDFTAADVPRLAELDRTESVAMVYAVARRHLESGGAGMAAFDGDPAVPAPPGLGGEPVGGDSQERRSHSGVGRGYRRAGWRAVCS